MSGGKRGRDYWRLATAAVCGAILLLGLAAGNHWHRAAKAGVASPLEKTLESSARTAQPSFAAVPLSPPILHVPKLTPGFKSPPSAVRPELAHSSRKLPAAVAEVLSATLGHDDARYSVKNVQGGYTAENPANHLTASFTDEGLGLRLRQAHWGMKLAGWAYDDNVVAPSRVAPHVIANRAEYAGKGFVEWREACASHNGAIL
jgi:hypothetical protein